MQKTVIILILAFPLLNFLHEGGHWLGAKAVGQNPKMMLQRVDVGDETHVPASKVTVYNWGGPFVNYLFMAGGYVYAPLAPFAFVMATHRLAPNVFASYLYLRGNTRFTNDETKQFPEQLRVYAATSSSIVYLMLSLLLLHKWAPELSMARRAVLLFGFPTLWLAYLIGLDLLDQKFFS